MIVAMVVITPRAVKSSPQALVDVDSGNDDDAAENTCYPSTDTNDPAKRYFYRYVFSDFSTLRLERSS